MSVWTVYTVDQRLRRYHVEAPTGEEASATVAQAIRERRALPAPAWEGDTGEYVLDVEEGVQV